MSDEEHLESGQEQDRRRYFRIEDHVGLALTPIEERDEQAAIAGFDNASARIGLVNELRTLRDTHLPQRRGLEYKFPTVAAYIKVLEAQIDTLALAICASDDFASSPNKTVNLSAQGIAFDAETPLMSGSLVEVRLSLFPEHSQIKALARVARSDAGADGAQMAVEFSHLRDADREAIIRHVHMLQRLQLRASAEALEDADTPASKPMHTPDKTRLGRN